MKSTAILAALAAALILAGCVSDGEATQTQATRCYRNVYKFPPVQVRCPEQQAPNEPMKSEPRQSPPQQTAPEKTP